MKKWVKAINALRLFFLDDLIGKGQNVSLKRSPIKKLKHSIHKITSLSEKE